MISEEEAARREVDIFNVGTSIGNRSPYGTSTDDRSPQGISNKLYWQRWRFETGYNFTRVAQNRCYKQGKRCFYEKRSHSKELARSSTSRGAHNRCH